MRFPYKMWLCVVAAVTLVVQPCLAQVIERIRPKGYEQVKPREPAKPKRPTELPEPQVDLPDSEEVIVKALKAVRFIAHPKDILKKPPETPGVHTRAVEPLDNKEFRALIEPFIGKAVSWKSIGQIVRTTILYYRGLDRPVVDVIVPEQEITIGVLQLLVIEGRIGKVAVEGNRYFSDQAIRRNVRVREGDVIYASRLLSDIDFINQNAFRYVRPVLSPGKELGATDLTLQTTDRVPVRFYVGYEDTGNQATGLGRHLYGLNMGNLFGREHELGYQYTTNRRFDGIGVHSAYYRIPLANHHKLAFFGSYASYDVRFLRQDLHGRSWQVGTRYIVPLPARRNYRHELQAGLDFKRSDNDIEMMGTAAGDWIVDVTQFVIHYGGSATDARGTTSFTLSGYCSPGGIGSKQSKDEYNQARAGSDPQYLYTNLALQRVWDLPHGASLVNRLVGQLASDRLGGSELLGFGGFNSVRGYDQRLVNSDQGLTLSVELRSPELKLGRVPKHPKLENRIQFLAFWDYGHARNISRYLGEDKASDLQSVGVGLRYRLTNHIELRLDYGHRLTRPDTVDNIEGKGRIHFAIVMSF